MVDPIYTNALIRIEIEEATIPWLKVFSQYPYREFSEAPKEIRVEIFRVLDIIEKEMLVFFKPEKINLASFGNHLPHLHWHIMARFQDDSHFPEPMWGSPQREGSIHLEGFEAFIEHLQTLL